MYAKFTLKLLRNVFIEYNAQLYILDEQLMITGHILRALVIKISSRIIVY